MIQYNNPMPNGGVPFFANDFTFMQDMQLTLFNIMLEQYYPFLPIPSIPSLILSGLNVGLSGTTTITSISSGHVILNRQLYWFAGASGLSNTTVYIIPGSPTTQETRSLENNNTGIVKIQNIAIHTTTAPSSGTPFIQFNPLPTVYLNDLMFRTSKKIGEIIPLGLRYNTSPPYNPLFGPNNLPLFNASGTGLYSYNGFALCNGNNYTPNLQGRFLVGTGTYIESSGTYTYNVGDTGINGSGESQHKLSITEMPSHNHNNGSYNLLLARNDAFGGNHSISNAVDYTAEEPDLVRSGTIQAIGGNGYHENRPPYYASAYIQRIS